MPTTRPRYTLTETDELARALDAAARVWPEFRDDRATLLRRILQRGEETVMAADEARRAGRRAAIREGAGSLTGVYPPNARQELLEEWPE